MVASIVEKLRPILHQRSGVWVHEARGEIAEAVADGCARGAARCGDPEAQLAPFADAGVAERISDMIDSRSRSARRKCGEAGRRPAGHAPRQRVPAADHSSLP